MMGGVITLVLADDHQVFVEGLSMMLDAQDDLRVLGVAADGAEALALTDRHAPAVLVLDAHMPRTDAVGVVREVKQREPGTKVLVLSADASEETVAAVIDAGADGFLAKDASSPQVAEVIRKLAEGHEGPITAPAPARPVRDPAVELLVRTLSAREREILGYLAAGYSNRRIAEHCYLSLNTVRTHVQNVLVKLGVHSKLEAVAFALEHRVVPAADAPPPAWPAGGRA
jgi:DNA-binding NarL/FixJ family response regulator